VLKTDSGERGPTGVETRGPKEHDRTSTKKYEGKNQVEVKQTAGSLSDLRRNPSEKRKAEERWAASRKKQIVYQKVYKRRKNKE